MNCGVCVFILLEWLEFIFSIIKFNECSIAITLCLLVIRARRPVHNHALVSTAHFPGSTWLKKGRSFIGTLPPLASRLSISLWLTTTSAGFYLFYPSGIEQELLLQRCFRALFFILFVNIFRSMCNIQEKLFIQ